MFKGELFLGAGSLLYATGTRNMEKMGGLFRRMPVTAVCFLIGALAISAIPPLNGFVSEWFTYQSLFNISTLSDPVVMVFAVASAAALAITGAPGRHVLREGLRRLVREQPSFPGGRERQGVPGSDVVLADAPRGHLRGTGNRLPGHRPGSGRRRPERACRLCHHSHLGRVSGERDFRCRHLHPPAIAIALVVLTGLAFALRSCLGAKAPAKKTDPWACGYEPNEHMPVVATSFASDVELFMGPLYTLREVCTKICWSIAHVFQKLTGVAQGVEPLPDRFLVDAPSEGCR